MRSGWQTKPFEMCIEKVTYTQKIQRKDFLEEGAYPIISQEDDFINGYWDNDADIFKVTTPIVIFGDHTKAFKYVDFDFVLGADGVKVLQPRAFLLPKFFFYQLQTANLDSLGYARHYKLLKELKIAYPTRPEQQRIVGILDEAFEGIATAKANTEKNLNNARAIFESHLQFVFTQRGEGWDGNTQLENLTDPKSPITYGVVKPGDEGEVTFIRGGDLARGRILTDQLRTITQAVSQQYKRTLLRGGELLISLVGQPGQVAVAPPELAGANIARQVGLIRLQPRMNAEFVRFFLQSPVGQAALGARQSGSVQQVINLGELRQVGVPMPPINVQKQVVEILETASVGNQRLEVLYERKLAALEALKKSLLHQAFIGEL